MWRALEAVLGCTSSVHFPLISWRINCAQVVSSLDLATKHMKMVPEYTRQPVFFNAPLLKEVRQKLGWTQRELAKHSNLSVRVIAKAEAGGSVGIRTLKILEQTLNDVGEKITVEDLRRNPCLTVATFLSNYSKYGKRSVAASSEILAQQINVSMDGDCLLNPLSGTYKGRDEFEALLYKFFDIFVRDSGTLGDPTQIRLAGREVIAWGHEFVRVPESPPSLPTFMMLRFEMRRGLITQIHWYYDAAGLMSRLEAWSKLYPHAAWINCFDRNAFKVIERQHPSPSNRCHISTNQNVTSAKESETK